MRSLWWAGLLGVLDGVQSRSNVKVFGLEESGEPAPLISEAHRQHLSQRLHQVGVRLCGGQREELTRGQQS